MEFFFLFMSSVFEYVISANLAVKPLYWVQRPKKLTPCLCFDSGHYYTASASLGLYFFPAIYVRGALPPFETGDTSDGLL
jgi:hypothetical protein